MVPRLETTLRGSGEHPGAQVDAGGPHRHPRASCVCPRGDLFAERPLGSGSPASLLGAWPALLGQWSTRSRGLLTANTEGGLSICWFRSDPARLGGRETGARARGAAGAAKPGRAPRSCTATALAVNPGPRATDPAGESRGRALSSRPHHPLSPPRHTRPLPEPYLVAPCAHICAGPGGSLCSLLPTPSAGGRGRHRHPDAQPGSLGVVPNACPPDLPTVCPRCFWDLFPCVLPAVN